MALLIQNKTVCNLCGEVIAEGEDALTFPAFILNENDPLYYFSDASFHSACVHKKPIGEKALFWANEWLNKTGPGKRKCCVCEEEVTDPDNYFLIEHLTDDKNHPVYRFNYTHLHRSCIKFWKNRDKLSNLIAEMQASGKWAGAYLDQIQEMLKL